MGEYKRIYVGGFGIGNINTDGIEVIPEPVYCAGVKSDNFERFTVSLVLEHTTNPAFT